jgi:serine/threonine protein phosphatase PrpC/predicted Ser/Thr protein kinase
MPLLISLGRYSSSGAKPANQDFHGSLVPEEPQLTSKGIVVAIADGISTSALGAQAAETAVKSFLTDYYATSEAWSVGTSAERVIAATNSWMHAQNVRSHGRKPNDEEREHGLISTFSALVLKSRSAHVFHVGDARIARIVGEGLEVLTEPHRVHVGGGQSYLARALGMDRNVEIECAKLALQHGDIFVLTTDGVHEFLPDAQLARLVAQSGSLDDVARNVAEAALRAGSADNLTVQVVRIDQLPQGVVDDLLGDDISLPSAPLLTPGHTFEGYAILRELHASARSHVYLARDLADGRRVAIKVASTEHAADSAAMRALLLEEWIARRIDHPHVLKAAPARVARRHAYSVSEFIEGQSLAQWMDDHGAPDLAAVRSLITQVASGLQALHRREILHRDLRLQNIIVDAEGTVKLIDFGSAQVAGLDDIAPREFEDAAFAGTMQYSAPEVYLGAPASRASDLFSLGVIAYQLLTGQLPYGPRVASANFRAQKRLRYISASQINPEVPDWMDAALAKATRLDQRDRYSDLSEFIYDLSHPNPMLTHPEARPWLFVRPERIWQVTSAVLLILLLVAIFRR